MTVVSMLADQSTLKDLPGPSELYVALETAMVLSIEGWKRWEDFIIPVIQLFQGEPSEFITDLLASECHVRPTFCCIVSFSFRFWASSMFS